MTNPPASEGKAAENWRDTSAAIIARGERRASEAGSIDGRIHIRFDTLLELSNTQRDFILAAIGDVRRHRVSKASPAD